MPLQIRPLQPTDDASLRARFGPDGKPPWLRLPHPFTLDHVLTPSPSLTVFVAEVRPGEAVGLLAIDEAAERPLVIGPVVSDDQLAELYGRALLDYGLGWARINGIGAVRVKLDLDEERGLAFFIYQGFGVLETRQYLLEARPTKPVAIAEPEGFSFGPAPDMLSSDYLPLYEAIGTKLGWADRSHWTRPQVFEYLQRPGLHLLACREGENFIGFAELEERVPGEAELVRFGLLEDYRGRGLGGVFLAHVLAHAWQLRLNVVRVNAFSTEPPGVLPNYLKHGFVKARAMAFLEKDLEVETPTRTDLLAP